MRSNSLVVVLALMLVLAGCAASSGSGGVGGGNVGLAVGGAQDANAFRDNVHGGYVPQPTDVTYEGLFHDYYFETGRERPCEATFCPSYGRGVSTDPLSNETEYYLTVGLNSGVNQSAFEREPLDLVVVVDTSGSMSDSMRTYHYDETNGTPARDAETTQKMTAAKSALKTLTGHLGPNDRLGIVAYDDDARVVRDLRSMDGTDRDALNRSVEGLRADGGTNLDAGMRTAKLLAEDRAGEADRETRIVYVTDAMPNLGDTDGESLQSRLRAHEDAGIHTTFVGVGVDFNSRLVESITSVRGANYYAVHSTAAFRDRMDEGFDHMVTPMAYDLSVTVESEGYDIERVYGSPEAKAATGEVMHATTLFPSRTSDGKTEGGVVLLELERTGEAETLDLTASYETPDGERKSVARTVRFADREAGYYETTGTRKAVVLSRYATLLRNWAVYERAQATGADPETPADGVEARELGEWEQRSVSLRVSPVYRDRFARFAAYFETEMAALGDDDLREDLVVLRTLRDHEGEVANGTPTATAAPG